jgi:hypothetical protein
MTAVVITALLFALVATVLALCREVRLRKALQRLLQIVLTRWRIHATKSTTNSIDTADDDVDPT